MANTQRILNTRIVLRNDTKNNWNAVKNTAVLSKGEIGIEIDTNLIKIGDGVKTWAELDYFGGDLSDYYTKEEVEALVSGVPSTDLSGYYKKSEVDALLKAEEDARKAKDESIDAAIELLTNGAGTDVIDSVNELIDYVTTHGPEVTKMQEDIAANAAAIEGKVSKDGDKVLSDNNFTDALLSKLNGIEANANKYVLPTDVVKDSSYRHITVTSTSVSDGANTFTKYNDSALQNRVSTLEGKKNVEFYEAEQPDTSEEVYVLYCGNAAGL